MSEIESNDSTQSFADDFRAAAFALGISGETVARMANSPERALACVQECERLGKGPGLAVHMFDAGDWPKERKSSSKDTRMNAFAPPSDCALCDGDRFVMDGLYRCPQCNHQEIAYTRFDGSRFEPPSPERVRELMQEVER